MRKNHIDRNPLDKVEHPKKNKFHPAFYSKEEAIRLPEIAKDDPCYIPSLLGIYYGMRCSEAIGLQWNSVDFENNQIHDARHSCARMLVAAGVPMKQVQLRLGHSTFSATVDSYAHLNSSVLVESAACMEFLLASKVLGKEAVPV